MKNAAGRIAGLILIAAVLPACGTGGGSGTLTPTIAPGIPGQVEVRPGNRSVTVSWAASAAGATYTVLRSVTSSGPYFPISVPGQFRDPTTYVDIGLTNGTSYYYAVRAENSLGTSPPSPAVSATPGFSPSAVSGSLIYGHYAIVLPDGSVWEWGLIAGPTEVDAPSAVPGLENITSVAVGASHRLALASDGRVWAWGSNSVGQLGTGPPTLVEENLPAAPVPGLAGMVAVATGSGFSVALNHDGTVWAWGMNASGIMGIDPAFLQQTGTPTQVPGLSRIIAIGAGQNHALALRNDGLVYGWGGNSFGQTGNGTASSAPVLLPALIDSLNGVVALAPGDVYSLALRADGTVMGWGANSNGMLGSGAALGATVLKPLPVAGLSGVTDLASGGFHALALKSNGTVWAWGKNVAGQFGNGTTTSTANPAPVQIPSLSAIKSIAISNSNTLAVGSDGTLRTCGSNDSGELGNSSGGVQVRPLQIPNLTGMTAVAAGQDCSLSITSTGTVLGWGLNLDFQMGTGSSTPVVISTPAQAVGVAQATAVASGSANELVRRSDGTLLTWGYNTNGQLGVPTASVSYSAQAVPIPGISGVASIAVGQNHSIALKSDGTVWTWGYNGASQIGYVTPLGYSDVPTPVPGLAGMVSVAAGYFHSLAAKNDGTVWTWGTGSNGQLGLGAQTLTAVPLQVPNLTGVVAVAAGRSHSLAIRNDGTVWCWGWNLLGQLGNGETTDRNVPVQVTGLTGVTAVSGGFLHSMALRSDGTVWTWGQNAKGQLGNPVSGYSSTPVPVLDLGPAAAITAGYEHNLVLLTNGTIWGWGSNTLNQLSIPSVLFSSTPVVIRQ